MPIPDLFIVPDNVIDMDEYRARRIKEGTWPPDDATVRQYWLGRRNMGVKHAPPPKPSGSAA